MNTEVLFLVEIFQYCIGQMTKPDLQGRTVIHQLVNVKADS